MSALMVRERARQEADIARDWWRLPPQTLLPLEDGRRCLLLYSGRPGGSAGPDVRDAVLRFLSGSEQEGARLAGDVEFHVRAGDWFAHGHHLDPRYNHVILHVVLYPDGSTPTRRQDGNPVPTCTLLDLLEAPAQPAVWPCQQRPLSAQVSTTTLLYAGLLRFTQKSQALLRALTETQPQPDLSWDRYDTCLLPALAEGLGYGRDRAFFRAVGLRLVGLPAHIPEPLGRSCLPAPLDARRLRLLALLSARWRRTGAWQTLRQPLQQDGDVKSVLAALRAALHPLSRARTDILMCNIVLPFAVAVAQMENDARLAARAHQLYLTYPGLVSNRVTRMMTGQLQLSTEPAQACLQQGLHHIYTTTCQAKSCENCLCGGQRL